MQLAVAHTSADAKEVLAYLQNPPAQPNAPPKAVRLAPWLCLRLFSYVWQSDFDFNAPEFAQLQLLVGGAPRFLFFFTLNLNPIHTPVSNVLSKWRAVKCFPLLPVLSTGGVCRTEASRRRA